MSVLDRFTKLLPTPLRYKIDETLARVIYKSGAAQPFHELNRRVSELEDAKGTALMLDYFEARLDGIYANLLKTPTFGPPPTSPAAALPPGFFTTFADEIAADTERLREHHLAIPAMPPSAANGSACAAGDTLSYLQVHQKRIEATLRLLQTLEVPPEALVVDLGCWAPFVPMLQRTLPGRELIGVTAPGEQPQSTVDQRGARWVSLDLEEDALPIADGAAQVVLLLEVIEHLYRDPMFALAEANRVLAPGGKLVISTPNLASWRAIAAVLMNFSPYTYGKYAPDHPRNRHVHEYVPREVEDLLTSAGFVARCFTEDVYHTRESEKISTLLAHLGLPTDLRGDSIFAVGVKTGPVVDRYPPTLYDAGLVKLR